MKKEKKYLVLGIAFSLLVLMGVTYAYFTTRIIGDKKNVTIDMAELKVIFTNGDAIEASEVYAEDNLDIIKPFSVENKTKNEYKYNIVIEDLVNTFVTEGYLVYKITSTDGGYNMTDFEDVPKSSTATDTVLTYSVSIPAKSIHNYNIEIKYIYSETEDQNADQGAKISGKLYIEGFYRHELISDAIYEDNQIIPERTDFSETNTENTTGSIYQTDKTEDGSTVYYYSGSTNNNWVKFGKYKNDKVIGYSGLGWNGESKLFDSLDECKNDRIYGKYCNYLWKENDDMYWRIIRTNEDGGIRLLYSGNNPSTTEGYIGSSAYNLKNGDPVSVGYMYGTSGSLENNRQNTNDSVIKTYIDNWYETNLLSDYDKYISKTAIYCNDRSVGTGTYDIADGSNSPNKFSYGTGSRVAENNSPSYRCGDNGNGGLFETTQAIEDKFSASTEGGGNGQLKYPIALMTADEVAFAGGSYLKLFYYGLPWYLSNSNGDFIVKSKHWWLLSPIGSNTGRDGSSKLYSQDVFVNYSSYFAGQFTAYQVEGYWVYVRPVISLDRCATIVSGDGTPENPYVVDENSCS